MAETTEIKPKFKSTLLIPLDPTWTTTSNRWPAGTTLIEPSRPDRSAWSLKSRVVTTESKPPSAEVTLKHPMHALTMTSDFKHRAASNTARALQYNE